MSETIFFKVSDTVEFLNSHGYKTTNGNRFEDLRMSSDLLPGIKKAADQNQTQIVIQYLIFMMEILQDSIHELRADVKELASVKKSATKAATTAAE